MEVDCMVEMFSRSEEKFGVKYGNYLGDGDSKTFKAILELNPYGDELTVVKSECIGHVEKRMGTRLRNVRKEKKLSGRGKLTDKVVKKLTKYYGLSIQGNVDRVENMKKEIMATFYHIFSTKEKPNHEYCPTGPESWCKWQKAIALNKNPKLEEVSPLLDENIKQHLLPIYQDLSRDDLLERCLGGHTQNANECFNSTIWRLCPKHLNCGLKIVEISAYIAAGVFNDGFSSILRIMNALDIIVGTNCRVFAETTDEARIVREDRRSLSTTKEARTARKKQRMKISFSRKSKVYCTRLESLINPHAGQVGCVACNMRTSTEAHIGDTLHLKNKPVMPLTGFVPATPMVFAGIYPMDQSQHVALRGAIEKLILNDSAVTISVEDSPALGQGWRLGFLGLLHMEVFTQRLEHEYGAEVIVTAPGVTYKAIIIGAKNIIKYRGEEFTFNNPMNFPGYQVAEKYYEPVVRGTIITPDKYMGGVISLCIERRGVEQSMKNIDNQRVVLQYVLPLNEIIVDFHDTLKLLSSGYASFDYEHCGYELSNIVKVEIHLNGTLVEELSIIVHCTRARETGKRMCSKLVNIIPRQQFVIAIQAKVGGKILARETLKAFRKDVTAKLYGGDVTRKMKLLAKQAAGKRKMRMVGNIALPRETFINVLKK